MPLPKFETWAELQERCIQETGCRPFSGAGINYRKEKQTSLLRSVDGTAYYDDDLTNPDEPKYTCQGKLGDQSEMQAGFNEPLLNPEKTKHIYLYRVSKEGKKTIWTWYGKYKISGKIIQRHPGEDGVMRNIIVLTLKK